MRSPYGIQLPSADLPGFSQILHVLLVFPIASRLGEHDAMDAQTSGSFHLRQPLARQVRLFDMNRVDVTAAPEGTQHGQVGVTVQEHLLQERVSCETIHPMWRTTLGSRSRFQERSKIRLVSFVPGPLAGYMVSLHIEDQFI